MPHRLLLHTHGMTGGGAERVVALLASGLARRGHEVVLAVDYEASENAAFLDPAVEVAVLGRAHGAATRALRDLLLARRPHASLSAIGVSNGKHLLAALAAGRRDRAVLTHHGYLTSEPQPLSRLANLATPVASRLAARSVFVSDGLMGFYRGRLLADPARSLRVHNPVAVGAARAPSAAELAARPPKVLAVGRLTPAKDFPGLVRAFARVRYPGAHLTILGEGPERGRIDAEIARQGLGGRVRLPGYTPEPWAHYDRARAFALSSTTEAFGNVVVEALAHGLPVVSTACEGPTEILEGDGGHHGALVPIGDEAAMAGAIDAALDAPGDPAPRAARAAAFAPGVALDAYEALFDAVAGAARSPA